MYKTDSTLAPETTLRTASNFGVFPNARIFRQRIKIYQSRTETLALGFHIDLSTLASWAGFRAPVFIQRRAFECFASQNGFAKSKNGDLFELVQTLRQAVMRSPLRDAPVLFQVGEVSLIGYFGPVDYDDQRPAITVALADSGD
jgi:hypothetical protein